MVICTLRGQSQKFNNVVISSSTKLLCTCHCLRPFFHFGSFTIVIAIIVVQIYYVVILVHSDLIFVTNPTNIFVEKKSVMWINFRFLYMWIHLKFHIGDWDFFPYFFRIFLWKILHFPKNFVNIFGNFCAVEKILNIFMEFFT